MLKCKSNLSIPLAAKFISGTALLETGKERFVHRGRGLHGDYCDCNCPVMYPVKPHRLKDTEACSEHQNCLASLFMHVAVLPWPKSNYFSLQNMIFFFFFHFGIYISSDTGSALLYGCWVVTELIFILKGQELLLISGFGNYENQDYSSSTLPGLFLSAME